jgi:hypothetical protein
MAGFIFCMYHLVCDETFMRESIRVLYEVKGVYNSDYSSRLFCDFHAASGLIFCLQNAKGRTINTKGRYWTLPDIIIDLRR